MQGEIASPEEVAKEFIRRQEVIKSRATEDEENKLAMKSQSQSSRTRRGELVAGKTYVTGDLTEEEAKDPSIVRLVLKPYNQSLGKSTSFFTDYKADRVLKALVDILEKNAVTYEISNKTWKISFTKTRDADANAKEGEPCITESAGIIIELLDAADGKICVEFKRKFGSSMIFYDWFNTLRDEIAHVNNVAN